MAQTVKIESMGANGIQVKEVSLQEAKRIVKEAYARGSLVLDKRAGEIIEEPSPNTEELLILDMIAGG